MPISRPLQIALVLAIVAVAGFYATQGGRDATDVEAPVIVTDAAPPETKDARRATGDRQTAKLDRSERADGPRDAGRARRDASRPKGVPPEVRRAIRARKRVVLFFFKPGSADDRATARGVAALRGERGVAVFSDPIARLGRYRSLIGDLGISQAPAVVIVGRDRQARVVEGYVDPASLAQDVADTR